MDLHNNCVYSGGMAEVTVGENVRRLRKAAGMSQAELAAAMRERGQLHWRQNTVSRVENGRQPLDFLELEPLGEILGNILDGTAEAQSISRAFTGRDELATRIAYSDVVTPEFQQAADNMIRAAVPRNIREGRRELDRLSERLESAIEVLGATRDNLEKALAERDMLRERLAVLERMTTRIAGVEAGDDGPGAGDGEH